MRAMATIGSVLFLCGAASGQEAATSAADLIRALEASGYSLPEGFALNADGTVSVPAVEAEAPPVVESLPTAEAEPLWDQQIEAALNISEGNTENSNIRVGYVGVRETETSRLTLDAAYYYGTDGGTTSENRATAGALHDWLLPDSKWIIFAQARADYDQFNSWRYRLSGFGGVGYELVDNDTWYFTPRAGAGVTKEFGSGRNELIPEGLLGFDTGWYISDRQSLEMTYRYYPSFADVAEYRMVTTAGWKMDLDNIGDGLGLSAGLLHEYQSEVDPGADESDLKIFAGLLYDF